MNYKIFFYFLIIFTAGGASVLLGVSAFYKTSKMNIRFNRNRFKEFRDNFKEQFTNETTETLFQKTGFNITGLKYQVIRYAVLVFWMLYMLYLQLVIHSFDKTQLYIWLILFGLSSPRETFFGKKTPLMFIIQTMQTRFNTAKNKEIYRAISQLKNLSMSKSNEKLSSDYIIEELMKYTKITKPIFSNMLTLWYENSQDAACEYFSKAVGTDEGKELADIIRKLDDLTPFEQKEQLKMYQHMSEEKRKTARKTWRETRGNYIYALVMFSAIMVLVNFVVIIIFIDFMGYYTNLKIK